MLFRYRTILKKEYITPTVYVLTWDDGILETREFVNGVDRIVSMVFPQRPLPHLKGWKLNMGGETV